MKPNEHIIGEAIRIEYDEINGRLFIVFEIIDENNKQYIMKNWMSNIEFKFFNKNLIKNDDI